MISLSHWGMFDTPARGFFGSKQAAHLANNYANQVNALYDQKYLHGQQDYQLYFNTIPKQKI